MGLPRTEGEMWARDRLRALGGDRFRPRAVVRFLVASQRRSGRIRRERPDLARRARHWIAIGTAAWLGLAAARVQPFRRRCVTGLGSWAVTAAMLDWHLGMVETEDGRPRNLGAADAATLLRAWLVPAVADAGAPSLFAVGLATDVVDGRLARAAEPTRLGRDLEGLVDAAFGIATLRGMARAGRLPGLAAGVEAARVTAGVGYATAAYFERARPPSRVVLGAGRATAPLRGLGMLIAALGHRRAGTAVLLAGSSLGLARAGVSSGGRP